MTGAFSRRASSGDREARIADEAVLGLGLIALVVAEEVPGAAKGDASGRLAMPASSPDMVRATCRAMVL